MSFFDTNIIAKEQLHGVRPATIVAVVPVVSVIGAQMSSPSRRRLVYADVISLMGGTLTLMMRRKRKRIRENE